MSETKLIGKQSETASLYKEVLVNSNGALMVSGSSGGGTTENKMKANDGDDGAGTERSVRCDDKGILNVGYMGLGEVLPTGSKIQQVLIMGKKSDNTIQPLETNGDRLVVHPNIAFPSYPASASGFPGDTAGEQGQVVFMGGTTGHSTGNKGKLRTARMVETAEFTTALSEEIVPRLQVGSKLIGQQEGAVKVIKPLICDSNGNLHAGLGAYSDLSDLGSWGRLKAETNYGSLFVRSKNSTNSTAWVAVNVPGQSSSASISCVDTTTFRIWGDASTTDPLVLEFSNNNSNFIMVELITPVSVNGRNAVNKYYNLSPGYIRLFNTGNAGDANTLNLYVEQGHD